MAKPDFREHMAEDRRLIILEALTQANEYFLNEDVIQKALEYTAHAVGSDIVRSDLVWLSEHRLVRIEKVEGRQQKELWIAKLTREGEEVGRGRSHPGVRRPMAI